jgi:hypothetical protein
MNATEFERLCGDLCVLLGAGKAGPLQRRDDAFVVRLALQDFDLDLMHLAQLHPLALSAVIGLGRMERAGELDGWLQLLEANRSNYGVGAPRFGRDPETGNAILQCAFDTGATSLLELHRHLVELVELARTWRREHGEAAR